MKKRQYFLFTFIAAGFILFVSSCGPTSHSMVGYIVFGKPTKGPTTNGPVNVDSTAAEKTISDKVGTVKTLDKNATISAAKSDSATAKAIAAGPKLLPAKPTNTVSCIGEGACSQPAATAANASIGAIPVTFTYDTQNPNSILLIFSTAGLDSLQPGQLSNFSDGAPYTFGDALPLTDSMYKPLGIQGNMMIPANVPGTVKVNGQSVTITMPVVATPPGGQ